MPFDVRLQITLQTEPALTAGPLALEWLEVTLRVVGGQGVRRLEFRFVFLYIDFLSLVSALPMDFQRLCKVCPPLTSGPIALQSLHSGML